MDTSSTQTVGGAKTFSGAVAFSATLPALPAVTPSNPTDAVTKAYADSIAVGLQVQAAAAAATTVSDSYTYTISGGTVTSLSSTTVDGQALTAGQFVLIKDCPATSGNTGSAGSSEPGNGLYHVDSASGTLSVSRASGMTGGNSPVAAFVFVEAGGVNEGAGYVVTTPASGAWTSYGSGSIQWTQFSSAAGSLTPDGTTLSQSGSTISLITPVTIAHGGTGAGTGVPAPQNEVFAGPSSGGAGTPSFRGLAASDVPTLNQNTTGTAAGLSSTLAVGSGGTGVPSVTAYAPVTGGTSSGGALQAVSNGGATSGQVLTYQGSSSLPTWTTVSGTVDTNAAHIQPLGTRSAGSQTVSAASDHVHTSTLTGWAETAVTASISSGTTTSTIAVASGNVYKLTLGNNATCTFTLTTATPSGTSSSVTVYLAQDSTGGRSVAWNNVTWLGGSTPFAATAPLAVTAYAFESLDGGSTWYGTQISGGPQIPIPNSDLSAQASSALGMFGDGSDGPATLDGTTTVLGMVPSSGVYTMTRDLHLTALQINSGATLYASGYRIFCQGQVSISSGGTLSAAGKAASGSTGGLPSGSGSNAGGRGGGAGGTGAGAAGPGGAIGLPNGPAGGGGAGSAGGAAGGAAGAGTSLPSGWYRQPFGVLAGVSVAFTTSVVVAGAPGGGGGGGDGANAGGGGGGGGGMITVFAYSFVSNGTMTVAGGNGGQRRRQHHRRRRRRGRGVDPRLHAGHVEQLRHHHAVRRVRRHRGARRRVRRGRRLRHQHRAGLTVKRVQAGSSWMRGSGLPWPSGAYTMFSPGATGPAAVNLFGAWRGRPCDVAVAFLSQSSSWTGITGGSGQFAHWKDWPGTMSFAVPLIPDDAGLTLLAGANGDYDTYWTAFANTISAVTTTAGAAAYPDAIIRLGWEFNDTGGGAYPWAVTGAAGFTAANYAAYWKRVVQVVQAIAPGLRFDWCVNRGVNGLADPTTAWPGNGVADYVGVDSYDRFNPYNYDTTMFTGAQGLNYWLGYAQSKGVLFSVPEWACWSLVSGQPKAGGGDDPDYITAYIDFFRANAPHIGYESMFQGVMPVPPIGTLPDAAAAYISGLQG